MIDVNNCGRLSCGIKALKKIHFELFKLYSIIKLLKLKHYKF